MAAQVGRCGVSPSGCQDPAAGERDAAMTTPRSAADMDGRASFQVLAASDSLVVVAAGEIDLSTAPAFCEALQMAAQKSDHIIVDLASLSFIDSIGIRELVTIRREHPHRRVALVQPPQMLRKLLDLTGLGDLFTVYESRQDAVAHRADWPNTERGSC
jgi:anti-sigma B factor antagonist